MKLIVLLIMTAYSSSIRFRNFVKHHKHQSKYEKEHVGQNLTGPEQVRKLLKSEQSRNLGTRKENQRISNPAKMPTKFKPRQFDRKKILHKQNYNRARLQGKHFLGKYDLRPQSAIFSYLKY